LTWSATSFATSNAPSPQPEKADSEREKPDERKFEPFKPEAVTSAGAVTVGGQAISYQAIAGTFIVHPKDWDDVPRDPKADKVG
ncbi:MAG: peptidase S10, partial [Gammaproteobacteria bacterium]